MRRCEWNSWIVEGVLYPDDEVVTLDLLDDLAACRLRRSGSSSGRGELDRRHLVVLLLLQIDKALVFGEASDNGTKGQQRHSQHEDAGDDLFAHVHDEVDQNPCQTYANERAKDKVRFHAKEDALGGKAVGFVQGQQAEGEAPEKGQHHTAQTPQHAEQDNVLDDRRGHAIPPQYKRQQKLATQAGNESERRRNHLVRRHETPRRPIGGGRGLFVVLLFLEDAPHKGCVPSCRDKKVHSVLMQGRDRQNPPRLGAAVLGDTLNDVHDDPNEGNGKERSDNVVRLDLEHVPIPVRVFVVVGRLIAGCRRVRGGLFAPDPAKDTVLEAVASDTLHKDCHRPKDHDASEKAPQERKDYNLPRRFGRFGGLSRCRVVWVRRFPQQLTEQQLRRHGHHRASHKAEQLEAVQWDRPRASHHRLSGCDSIVGLRRLRRRRG